jgi:PAS domain S-box-containing protein
VHLTELNIANRETRDARRAALNLMEDAVLAREAVETLNAALQDSERRFRELIDALPAAVYTTDTEGRITHFNPASVELSGRIPQLGTDQWCVSWKLYHPDGTPMPRDECPMAIALREGHAVRGAEVIIERPDGKRSWLAPYPTPLRDAAGWIVGGINMLVDITERKRAEQRQEVLTQELSHRIKNMLAVVQAITSASLSDAPSLEEGQKSLLHRIHALARNQSLLLDRHFADAPLKEIIRLELEAFSDRVGLDGPDVMLKPSVAQTFALLIHELATNAAKYGALSLPSGEVAIRWSVEGAAKERRLRFRWAESGGPRVTPPTRQGFGGKLIEGAAASEFRAQPSVRFAAEGLIYEFDAPLKHMMAEPSLANGR